MKWTAVESSQISEVGYDADSETLGIRFKAKGKWPASEYHYANVDKMLHESLTSGESVGKAFEAYIKAYPTKYPFTKVA